MYTYGPLLPLHDALPLVADRNVDRSAQAPHVVVSDRDVGIAFEVLRGLLGDVVDRAAGGIAAIERPLRAAQNLDALGVESGKQRSDGAADIDAVEVERDAGDRKSTRLNSSH